MNAWTAVPSNRRKITEADAELIDERVACFGHLRPLGRKFIPALHARVAVMRKELFLPSPGRRRPGPSLGVTVPRRALAWGQAQPRIVSALIFRLPPVSNGFALSGTEQPHTTRRGPGRRGDRNHRRSTKMAAL